MIKIKDDVFGFAIVIQDDYYYSAKDIMEKHAEVLKEKEFVYFSTDVKIDSRKLEHINTIIFYTNKQTGVFYIADLIGHASLSDASIPTDASAYSPKPYERFKRYNWLKLKHIRTIDFDALKQYTLLNLYCNSNYQNMQDYILHTKRRQAFYFTAK